MLHWIRNFCLFGLPLLLCFAAAWHFLNTQHAGAEAAYVIMLTANIGYFTNFIAIKMLFKPYQPTAFGRQGLIPRNQSRLAAALSATLSDHFLASDHWQEYLQSADLLPKMIVNLETFCNDWLAKPQNQRQLTLVITDYLKNNHQTLEQLFKPLQNQLVDNISRQIEPQSLLNESFVWIEKQFVERPQEMQFLIEPIVNTLAENIPTIARRLSDTLDSHIENQDALRRNIAKAAKWSANFNEDEIKSYLFRLVASSEFRQSLFEGLQTLVSEYKNRPIRSNGDSSQLDLGTMLNDLIRVQGSSLDFAKIFEQQSLDPSAVEKLVSFLQQSIAPLFSWLSKTLDSPMVNRMLNQQLVKLIESIDLREIIKEKASQFSPQKMELIFHSMIKDQLIFIELLGALLGGLSGLALVNMTAFVIMASVTAGYYGLDAWLTRYQNKV